MPRYLALTLLLFATMATPAMAHETAGVAGGFFSGFTHPLYGWDHTAAMVAVGLWGAFLGPPAIWMLPIVFPLVMAIGAAMGVAGVPVPAVEIGIAASAVVLGGMVATAAKPAMGAAAFIVGAFAIFHGHAHGTELPAASSALAYAFGFVISTGLLHLSGIALGLLTRWEWGVSLVRGAGGIIALAGLAFLSNSLA